MVQVVKAVLLNLSLVPPIFVPLVRDAPFNQGALLQTNALCVVLDCLAPVVLLCVLPRAPQGPKHHAPVPLYVLVAPQILC